MSLLRKAKTIMGRIFTKQGETTMGASASKTEATITKRKNGQFRLKSEDGSVLGDYKRRRDAVRGATRRGLTVA